MQSFSTDLEKKKKINVTFHKLQMSKSALSHTQIDMASVNASKTM